jgi:hypothetical protein
MSAVREVQASSAGEEPGLNSSQHAPGNNQTRQETRQNDSANNCKETTDLKGIAKDILGVKRGLEEEGVKSPWLATLGEIAARMTRVPRGEATCPKGVEARLTAIEETLKKAVAQGITAGTKQATWAAVAAGNMRQACAPEAIHPARHTVRATMPQAKGLSNLEILKEVKKTIPGAAAVRVLNSGDIDVAVPDEATMDKAQGIPPTEELKIHRKDYLVEVLGVPLNTKVASGKQADNSLLAAMICDSSKGLTPGIQITRIRWLYDEPQLQRLQATGKQRGSLLVGFPTQDMRRRAIQGGLVINAQLFEARQFERGLQETQCFKCQQWGHTQMACSKPARCALCAGPHASRDCPKERTSCANCGKGHKAWQRRECQAFQTYHETIQRRRVAMLAQSTRTRIAGKATTGPQELATEGWTRIARKKPREDSPKGDSQRRIGRPTHIEQAAKDPAQARLEFTPRASQAGSKRAATEMDPDTDPDEL